VQETDCVYMYIQYSRIRMEIIQQVGLLNDLESNIKAKTKTENSNLLFYSIYYIILHRVIRNDKNRIHTYVCIKLCTAYKIGIIFEMIINTCLIKSKAIHLQLS